MPENFNFSKIGDQQKFENLPEKEREEVVGEAREEAMGLQKKLKKYDGSHEAHSYDKKAAKEIKERQWIKENELEIEEKTNKIERLLHGYNPDKHKFENIRHFTEEVFKAEKRMIEEFENPEKATEIAKNKYHELAERKMQKAGFDDFVYIDRNWDKFKELLYIKKEKNNDSKLAINGCFFEPRIPIIEKGNEEMELLVEQVLNNSFFTHTIEGWGAKEDKGSKKELENFGSLIVEDNFKNRSGFYVTPSTVEWRGEDWFNKGSSGKVIYFNEKLIQLITPTRGTEAEEGIFPLYGSKIKLHHGVRDGEFYFRLNGIFNFYTATNKGTFANEPANPFFVTSLLAKKNPELSYYNDILGLILDLPPNSVTCEAIGNCYKINLHSVDPLYLRLFVDDIAIIREGDSIKIPQNMINCTPQKDGRNLIFLPILKIIPEIISGIIEYGEGSEVLKVAIPENNNFKIFETKKKL